MAERATFGITALRYAGSQIVGAMMGLMDTSARRWDMRPGPARVTEVVDRLLEGDTIISVFPDGDGSLQPGPEVKVDMQHEGDETLALDEDRPGQRLADLPRF
jgi:hypothetical protein